MNSKILDIIIDTILSEKLDWSRTWNPLDAASNIITKKEYRGSNAYLNLVGSHFITFNQAKQIGANIKKGARGYPVVYALIMNSEEQQGKKDFKGYRYYTVFDIKDCENIPADIIPGKYTETERNVLNELSEYLERENIKINLGNPAYSPTKDCLYMPDSRDFISENEYNATLAHEIIHSTGHEKRTNRHNTKESYTDHKFGSATYAKEELVAELGAMFMTGNQLSKNSIAYLQSWLKALASQDKKLEIYQAFQLAQKAIDYVRHKNISE